MGFFLVLIVENTFSIAITLLGHGEFGKDVAHRAGILILKLLLRDERFLTSSTLELLHELFTNVQSILDTLNRRTENRLLVDTSGIAATVIITDIMKKKLYSANVDDCYAVIGKNASSNDDNNHRLITRSHKPNDKNEKKRIHKAGGNVKFDGYVNYRVYYPKRKKYEVSTAILGGYPYSRSLGDILAHVKLGIISDPELLEYEFQPLDEFLIVASPGVWEFITYQEAVILI